MPLILSMNQPVVVLISSRFIGAETPAVYKRVETKMNTRLSEKTGYLKRVAMTKKSRHSRRTVATISGSTDHSDVTMLRGKSTNQTNSLE